MFTRWNEETLALTPETEQERALLNLVAATHEPTDWTRTPPPEGAAVTRRRRSTSPSPEPGS
jgi:hypothetical protein